jgi:hypothetical protein
MELREKLARAISKWPCHIDGFHAVGYSTAAYERWRATAYAQADEILALMDNHDSDCATHNEPAMPNGPCDCSLSRNL